MNYKEQCERLQQRHFQDMSLDWEGTLRENLVFVNATKPGLCHGMWDDLSLLSKMIHPDQGDRKKVGIWHSYNCQGQRKLSAVAKARVIKV